MKVVALVSGGKDSCHAMYLATAEGHEVVALANLLPKESEPDELDSYMFQTVGHQLVEAYASCMGVPLFRRCIQGTSAKQELQYCETRGDEVEDLFLLLSYVKEAMPLVTAVCSGAIASDYQRLRVENVCARLNLASLAYMWHQPQPQLLRAMIQSPVEAILVKVAALGLDPDRHLGKTLTQMEPHLLRLNEQFGCNVCGEGGEYETLVLDCPLFHYGRIVLDKYEVVKVSSDAVMSVGYLRPTAFHIEPKQPSCKPSPQPHLGHVSPSPPLSPITPAPIPAGVAVSASKPAAAAAAAAAALSPSAVAAPTQAAMTGMGTKGAAPWPGAPPSAAAAVAAAMAAARAKPSEAPGTLMGAQASPTHAMPHVVTSVQGTGIRPFSRRSMEAQPAALAQVHGSPARQHAGGPPGAVAAVHPGDVRMVPPDWTPRRSCVRRSIEYAYQPGQYEVHATVREGQEYVQVYCRPSSLLPCDATTEASACTALHDCVMAVRSALSALGGTPPLSLGQHGLYVQLFLANMGHFTAVNNVYCRYFPSIDPPSRACVQVPMPPGCPLLLDVLLARRPILRLDDAPRTIPRPALHSNAAALLGEGRVDRVAELTSETPFATTGAGSGACARTVLHVQSISSWAPSCIGPYSQANMYRGLIHMAGTIPLLPASMTAMTGNDIEAQTLQALANCQAVALALGCRMLGSALGMTLLVAAAAGREGTAVALATVERALQTGSLAPAKAARKSDGGSSSGGGASNGPKAIGSDKEEAAGDECSRLLRGSSRASWVDAGDGPRPDPYLKATELSCALVPTVSVVVVEALPRGCLVEVVPLLVDAPLLDRRAREAAQEGSGSSSSSSSGSRASHDGGDGGDNGSVMGVAAGNCGTCQSTLQKIMEKSEVKGRLKAEDRLDHTVIATSEQRQPSGNATTLMFEPPALSHTSPSFGGSVQSGSASAAAGPGSCSSASFSSSAGGSTGGSFANGHGMAGRIPGADVAGGRALSSGGAAGHASGHAGVDTLNSQGATLVGRHRSATASGGSGHPVGDFARRSEDCMRPYPTQGVQRRFSLSASAMQAPPREALQPPCGAALVRSVWHAGMLRSTIHLPVSLFQTPSTPSAPPSPGAVRRSSTTAHARTSTSSAYWSNCETACNNTTCTAGEGRRSAGGQRTSGSGGGAPPPEPFMARLQRGVVAVLAGHGMQLCDVVSITAWFDASKVPSLLGSDGGLGGHNSPCSSRASGSDYATFAAGPGPSLASPSFTSLHPGVVAPELRVLWVPAVSVSSSACNAGCAAILEVVATAPG